jgi:N-acetylmuramic acid 6-phosphate etherase
MALRSSGQHGSPSAADPPRPDETLSDLLGGLPTEGGGDPGADYELRTTSELVASMLEADEAVLPAVRSAARSIADAIDTVSAQLARGGRLIYVGAGSSGRLAALDAAECESTFSTAPGQVLALVAGGAESPPLEQEAAEDDVDAGAGDIRELEVGENDAVVGVSASGRTPYVLGAVEGARSAGARTVGIASVEGSELGRLAENEVVVVVGSEFLAGSTRLKAGTAQKLVLNMISTISMIRLGKTFGNLMVDVAATNEKLRARVRRIVETATGASPERVEEALVASDGNAKVAIVSLLADVDADTARARLSAAGENTRLALDGQQGS